MEASRGLQPYDELVGSVTPRARITAQVGNQVQVTSREPKICINTSK